MKKAVLSLLCAIFPLKTRRNKTQSVSAINKKKIFPFYTPVIDYGSNNSVVVYMPDGKKGLILNFRRYFFNFYRQPKPIGNI